MTERNEGWAAGLHLAALELGAQEDPSGFVRHYSGAFAPVSEYLEHEVLLCQPADLVRFLLQTSVLDRLTEESCLAITGRHDAGKILRSFADQNLFVIPVGPAEGVYRYHHLMADVLRSRLQREGLSVGRDAALPRRHVVRTNRGLAFRRRPFCPSRRVRPGRFPIVL